MDIESLVLKLKNNNVGINLVGHQIELDVPDGIDVTSLTEEIRSNKAELIKYIRTSNRQNGTSKIIQANQQEFYRLSSAQQRLYFLYELDRTSVAYNMPQIVRLDGTLDTERLEKAFKKLVDRHESLRTTFEVVNEEVVQKISGEYHLKISYFETAMSHVEEIINEFIRPFDLNHGPLLRVGLIRTSGDCNILMADMHHIISDGVSHGILIRDFLMFYNGETLRPQTLQYKDYSEWQRGARHRESLAEQKEFWLQEFSEAVRVMELPADYPRPLTKSHKGNMVSFHLEQYETQCLRKMGEAEGATLFMTLLSVFNVLLSKLTNQEDVVIGTPVAGRQHADLEGIIGMFVNTLPLRNYPRRDYSFIQFLRSVREKALACFDNQNFQYEELVEALKVRRDTGRNPLFDIMFVLQNVEEESVRMHGLTITPHKRQHTVSQFDLLLIVNEVPEKLKINIEYSTDLFSEKTIQRFVDYFHNLVNVIINDSNQKLSELEILSKREQDQLIHEFNRTETVFPRDLTITQLFESQVARTPDKIALTAGGRDITYRDLNERANQIAHRLIQIAGGDSKSIAVWAERSVEAVISILAILKSGRAYVPLDTRHPEERLRFILRDSKAPIILASSPLSGKLNDEFTVIDISSIGNDENSDVHRINGSATDLAYIMYTSGTTGNPKGVMISHRNVCRLVINSNYADLDESTRLLLTGALGFDATTFEIWGCLLNGGTLCIVPEETLHQGGPLGKAIADYSINTMWLTASLFNQHVEDAPAIFQGLKYLLVGGEALSTKHINKVRDMYPMLQIINGYGPTENTTFSVCHKIEKTFEHNIPIGKPISNSQAYILNESRRLVPIGVTGELYVGGDGLAMGYLNSRELTNEKFVVNPYKKGTLIYKTGDLARWLPDGNIEFLGRMDDQVKIRGYRIELSEIENTLKQITKDAVVLVDRKNEKDARLNAFVLLSDDSLTPLKLRKYLRKKLPDYMVPSSIIILDSFPLTPNGKTDKKALALKTPVSEATDVIVKPNTEIEKQLAAIWMDVIQAEKVGLNDTFFDLGGHSLLLISSIQKVSKCFNVELPIDAYFSLTLQQIAAEINRRQSTSVTAEK